MSLFSVLNIARGALSAAQTSVQVTSNNIANVNTTGYAREEADLEEATPIPCDFGTLGDGVNVQTVTRYYDKFLESAIQDKNSQSQQQSVLSTYLDRIQGFLNESNSNLTSSITGFFQRLAGPVGGSHEYGVEAEPCFPGADCFPIHHYRIHRLEGPSEAGERPDQLGR